MKKLLLWMLTVMLSMPLFAQTKQLLKPSIQRETLPVMEAFRQRKSVREYSTQPLSEQDLSDLLWAAQGKNRPDGHITAPTAMNRQEIRLYVFSEKEVSLYDPQSHSLAQVVEGDHRDIVAGRQDFAKTAPICLVMVADMDKFGNNGQHAQWMVAVDTGIVCENINLFCSAAGLCTVPRGTMDSQAIQSLLGLNENQIPLINNPVGYPNK